MTEDWMTRKLDFFDSEGGTKLSPSLLKSDSKVNRYVTKSMAQILVALEQSAILTKWSWLSELNQSVCDLQLSVDGKARGEFMSGIGLENRILRLVDKNRDKQLSEIKE